MRRLLLGCLMVATQAQPLTGSSPALAANGNFCPQRVPHVAAGFRADGTVSLYAHGGGDATPVVIGSFNASELVIGFMVAATAAE